MSWVHAIDTLTDTLIHNLNSLNWSTSAVDVLHYLKQYQNELKHVQTPPIHDGYHRYYDEEHVRNTVFLYDWIHGCLIDSHYHSAQHPQWASDLQHKTPKQLAEWAIRKYAQSVKDMTNRFKYV